jgi:hypothetical protein
MVEMTSDAIRHLLEATPFQPFGMRMPDGRIIAVPHPEFISFAPTGRIAIVWKGEGERYSFVDLRLVSDLEPLESKAKRKR